MAGTKSTLHRFIQDQSFIGLAYGNEG